MTAATNGPCLLGRAPALLLRRETAIPVRIAETLALNETQARHAHGIELLLRSRHAHLAGDSGSPAPRGQPAGAMRTVAPAGAMIDAWTSV